MGSSTRRQATSGSWIEPPWKSAPATATGRSATNTTCCWPAGAVPMDSSPNRRRAVPWLRYPVLRDSPGSAWKRAPVTEHLVIFYEQEQDFVDQVAGFLAEGLARGEACVVIATQAHRDAIAAELTGRGLLG